MAKKVKLDSSRQLMFRETHISPADKIILEKIERLTVCVQSLRLEVNQLSKQINTKEELS